MATDVLLTEVSAPLNEEVWFVTVMAGDPVVLVAEGIDIGEMAQGGSIELPEPTKLWLRSRGHSNLRIVNRDENGGMST